VPHGIPRRKCPKPRGLYYDNDYMYKFRFSRNLTSHFFQKPLQLNGANARLEAGKQIYKVVQVKPNLEKYRYPELRKLEFYLEQAL
jgi:hypothetical protein